MELFEAFDSTMAEILGENEYELLSKQAKVSDPIHDWSRRYSKLLSTDNSWSISRFVIRVFIVLKMAAVIDQYSSNMMINSIIQSFDKCE